MLAPFAERLSQILAAPGTLHPYPDRSQRSAWLGLPDDARQQLVDAGSQYLGHDWPAVQARHYLTYTRHGRQTDFLEVRNARRASLTALVLAECIEASGRFLDDIANGIWAMCEESYWGNPGALYIQAAGRGFPDPGEAIVELGTGETAALLAWTHELLGPALDEVSPMIRRRLQHELRSRMLDVCLQRDDLWWMGNTGVPVNNWTPWICSNWLTTVLLMEQDTALQQLATARILHCLDVFLDSYAVDGGCDEGPGYWNRAGGSLLECLELLHVASDGAIDVYHHEKVRNIGMFPARTQIADDWFVNFADAPATAEPSAPVVYTYGTRIGDAGLQRLGAWLTQRSGGLAAGANGGLARQLHSLFLLQELRNAEAAAPGYPRASWFPGIQVLAARQHAGSTSGLFVAAKGGTNAESHNHNDVGNVVVYVHGRPVLVDAGVGTYTAKTFSEQRYDIWTMSSGYHNLPQVAGLDQVPARRYLPGGVKYTDDNLRSARDVTCDIDADAVVFCADIAGAYPEAVGLNSWIRTVRLEVGDAPRVVVQDAMACSRAQEVVFSFITPCQVSAEAGVLRFDSTTLPDGRAAGTAVMHHDPGLRVDVETIPIDDPRLQKSWGERLYRIRLFPDGPAKAGDWSFEIVPPPDG